MSTGFVVNDNASAGNTTSFAVARIMLMHEDVAVDAKSLHGALPAAFDLEQVDFRGDLTAGGPPSTAKVIFTWDALGDDPLAGPSASIDITLAGTTANRYIGTASMGKTRVSAPAGQTTVGKCYAMVLVNAGTVTVPIGGLRLHWSDPREG